MSGFYIDSGTDLRGKGRVVTVGIRASALLNAITSHQATLPDRLDTQMVKENNLYIYIPELL